MNMIKNPQVTIVTAVYNKEELIHKCISSILSQNFKDFELILVDDGSSDNCPEICDDYAKKDSRIKVIHRENGGHALAVNTGVLGAKGEYITILDADDYFCDNDGIGEMVRVADLYNSDIVITDFLEVWKEGNQPSILNGTGIEILKYLIEEDIYHPTARSRLFKKIIFENNNLFKKLICDDEEWTPKTFFRAERVSILPKHIYFRTTPVDSVTQIATEQNHFRKAFDKAFTTGELINFFEETTISITQKSVLYKRFISLYLSSLHIYANKLTDNQLKSELFVVLNENKQVLKYSKFYDSSRHHFVAWIMRYFGLKPVLLFFKIFTR
jgi:glycosyltransferase involved in cell wall biosynthesis